MDKITDHFIPKNEQDTSPTLPHFFITTPMPCPYLKGQSERKLFAYLDTNNDSINAARLNNDLTQAGFRRSQNIIWRPACDACHACKSVRVRVDEHDPSPSQRRVLRRNRDLRSTRLIPYATAEQFALFKAYLDHRHATPPEPMTKPRISGDMTRMKWDDYRHMIEEGLPHTHIVEYRNGKGVLFACVLVDQLYDGLSLLYSFFDPREAHRSLGVYVILDQIAQGRQKNFPHLYLGYWVEKARKMAYKQRFTPQDVLEKTGWVRRDR